MFKVAHGSHFVLVNDIMSCEGRVVGARQFYLLSVDEISEVKKGPHLLVFSELGSLDLEPSSEFFLFLIYNHRSR